MQISMAMIFDRLPQPAPAGCPHDRCISNVVVARDALPHYEDSTLYIVTNSFFAEDNFLIAPKSLLYVKGCEGLDASDYTMPATRGWVMLEGKADAQELAVAVSRVISQYNRLGDKLLQMATEEDSIGRMVNALSAFLGLPVSIYDSGLKVISLSDSEAMKDDLLWQNSIDYGFAALPDSLTKELKEYLGRTEQEKRAFIFEAATMSHRFASANITINKKRIGMLQAVEVGGTLPGSILDVLEATAPYFAVMLQRSELLQQNAGIRYGQFIIDLVEGGITRDEDLVIRKKNVGWAEADAYQLLLAKPRAGGMARDAYTVLCGRVMDAIPQSRAVAYEGMVLAVVGHAGQGASGVEESTAAIEFLRANSLVACISNPFADLRALARLFGITQKALDWYAKGEPAYPIVRFADCSLEVLLEYALAGRDGMDFCHPAVLRLLQHDKGRQQAELVRTLKVYLDNGGNQSDTARALDIHRSTLGYRLRKIEELAGADLGGADLAFQLQLTLRILAYGGADWSY